LLADLEGATSNSIFEVLAEWERYLKSEEIDTHIPANGGERADIPPVPTQPKETSPEANPTKRDRPSSRFGGTSS